MQGVNAQQHHSMLYMPESMMMLQYQNSEEGSGKANGLQSCQAWPDPDQYTQAYNTSAHLKYKSGAFTIDS